jgi:hypothetical protein
MGVVVEMLQLFALALGALGRGALIWAENLWGCTGGFEARARVCGAANASAGAANTERISRRGWGFINPS